MPVFRLGIHPEMERPAILKRSMPSTAGATMSIPSESFDSSDIFHSGASTRAMKNAIYTFEKQYT